MPVDKYNNLYTDIFLEDSNYRNLNTNNKLKNKFNTKQEFLNSLTSAIFSNNNGTLEVNNFLDGKEFIKVQYKSFKTGNVKLTSPFFKGEFIFRIKSGPLDLNNSYIQIVSNETIKIGNKIKYIIHAKDLYGNDIDDLTEEIYVELFEKDKLIEIKETCTLKNDGENKELEYNILECSEIVTKQNYENITKFVKENSIKCINCNNITIQIDELESTEIFTDYVKTEEIIQEKEENGNDFKEKETDKEEEKNEKELKEKEKKEINEKEEKEKEKEKEIETKENQEKKEKEINTEDEELKNELEIKEKNEKEVDEKKEINKEKERKDKEEKNENQEINEEKEKELNEKEEINKEKEREDKELKKEKEKELEKEENDIIRKELEKEIEVETILEKEEVIEKKVQERNEEEKEIKMELEK